MPEVEEAQRLFIEYLPLIERVISFVCFDNNLRGADAEDFASVAKLKLIENDYEAIRRFAGRSSLATYLNTIIHRIAVDQHIQKRGKWRPSVAAEEEGPPAVRLEGLLYRDCRAYEEAARVVLSEFPNLSRNEVDRLRLKLPIRSRRPTEQTIETMPEVSATTSAEDHLMEKERSEIAKRIGRILSRELASCSPEDRMIVQWHFLDECKVSTIARALNTQAMPLYRRIYRVMDKLRDALLQGGISQRDATELVAHGANDLELAFDNLRQQRLGHIAPEIPIPPGSDSPSATRGSA
ncbi:MAG TPA: sigma-70 family RNA polymerase sigma factor [Thermoanaerobaculia bacterium]|nr:sigma-70 family RNA polymerase sigma factor [Thermoanaerobaculia bacterium]